MRKNLEQQTNIQRKKGTGSREQNPNKRQEQCEIGEKGKTHKF